MSTADVGALDTIIGQCQRFRSPDVRPLLTKWERRIPEDNERGILAGTDCFGHPMPAVTYRPIGDKPRKFSRADQQRHLSGFSAIGGGRREETSGNNLTSAQYRRLAGPPLAPRGNLSRVVTNLRTQQGYDDSRGVYFAIASWFDIVSRKGREFILAHFIGARTGHTTLPIRDLRGIRPADQAGYLDDLEAWGVAHVKATFI
jgi:hypothetical protein